MQYRMFLVVALLSAASLAVGCANTKEPEGASAGAKQPSAASSNDAAAGPEPALSDVVQLTTGFERAGEAYFSPDMGWIIFQATPKGEKQYAMFVAPLKKQGDAIVGAGTPVRISPPDTRNTCGYFSPDGQSLIFASTAGREKGDDDTTAGYQRQGGNYKWDFPDGMEIFRADNWRAAVEGATGGAVNLATHPITDNNAYDAEGAYSLDGKWIVFGSRRDSDSELYVMRPDGSDPVRLTHTPGYDGGPFFVPDGKRIVYRSDRKGNDLLQVFVADLVFDAAGKITGISNERQLTNDENVNWGPYFHPDNKHIIYATSIHGHQNYELYLMRDDGSHKTRITHTPGFDGLPVFSPDGKYLMWSSKRSPDNTTQIFLARFAMPAGA
jgi:TolB protein